MNHFAKVTKGGKVVVPAAVRKRLGLKDGGTLTFAETERGVELTTPERALRELQAYFKGLVPPGVSVVDELLAERRRENERDEAEVREYLQRHGRT